MRRCRSSARSSPTRSFAPRTALRRASSRARCSASCSRRSRTARTGSRSTSFFTEASSRMQEDLLALSDRARAGTATTAGYVTSASRPSRASGSVCTRGARQRFRECCAWRSIARQPRRCWRRPADAARDEATVGGTSACPSRARASRFPPRTKAESTTPDFSIYTVWTSPTEHHLVFVHPGDEAALRRAPPPDGRACGEPARPRRKRRRLRTGSTRPHVGSRRRCSGSCSAWSGSPFAGPRQSSRSAVPSRRGARRHRADRSRPTRGAALLGAGCARVRPACEWSALRTAARARRRERLARVVPGARAERAACGRRVVAVRDRRSWAVRRYVSKIHGAFRCAPRAAGSRGLPAALRGKVAPRRVAVRVSRATRPTPIRRCWRSWSLRSIRWAWGRRRSSGHCCRSSRSPPRSGCSECGTGAATRSPPSIRSPAAPSISAPSAHCFCSPSPPRGGGANAFSRRPPRPAPLSR